MTREANFDGIVGPTHHYGGLAYGNVPSMTHRGRVSSPKAAALQGLEKMKLLADLGLAQGVLPPHERPDTDALRRLGFAGSDAEVLERAWKTAPALLSAASSASAMWAANAATVSPSADTADGRVHLTPANLISGHHRSLEPETTARVLGAVFSEEAAFALHPPLPASLQLADEGAANHARLCGAFDRPGVELFVYGRAGLDPAGRNPAGYPARQTREASEAVARLHRLDPGRTLFARQNSAAVDAGVFHNDVISVGHQNVFLYHAEAFAETETVVPALRDRLERLCGVPLCAIEVPPERVSLREAVETYLFNSQVVTLEDGTMCLIAAEECRRNPRTKEMLDEILARENPICGVRYVDVRQSMRNGGGPACLRLRVVLTAEELARVRPSVWLTEALYVELRGWIDRHYRDRLRLDDLRDPALLEECRAALDSLSRILGLGSIYRFQREGARARSPRRPEDRPDSPKGDSNCPPKSG